MKNLVIDLDHTICTPEMGGDQSMDRNARYADATPDVALIQRMRAYRAAGFAITIHTSRNMRTYAGDVDAIKRHSLPVIVDWLDRHDVPYDTIVVGKPWCGTEGFYVDDRAVRPSEFRNLSPERIARLLDEERAS